MTRFTALFSSRLWQDAAPTQTSFKPPLSFFPQHGLASPYNTVSLLRNNFTLESGKGVPSLQCYTSLWVKPLTTGYAPRIYIGISLPGPPSIPPLQEEMTHPLQLATPPEWFSLPLAARSCPRSATSIRLTVLQYADDTKVFLDNPDQVRPFYQPCTPSLRHPTKPFIPPKR